MSKLYVLDNINESGVKGSNIALALTRSFIAANIVLSFQVNHDNADALAESITPYEFFGSCIENLRIDAGAGNDFINLEITYLMVRMLKDRRNLIYTIDKTKGDDKKSYLTLVVDFASVGMVNPKDTVLHTTRYGHLNATINIGEGAITNLTLKTVNVSIREEQIKDMKPLFDTNGKVVPPLHRKPVFISKSVAADQEKFTIELPKNEKFSSITIFAMDGKKIVSDVFTKMALKIKQNYRWLDTLDQLNKLNRLALQNYSNADFNGIAVMDIGRGQWTGAINTRLTEENSGQIELSVKKGSYSNPEIVALFETLIEA